MVYQSIISVNVRVFLQATPEKLQIRSETLFQSDPPTPPHQFPTMCIHFSLKSIQMQKGDFSDKWTDDLNLNLPGAKLVSHGELNDTSTRIHTDLELVIPLPSVEVLSTLGGHIVDKEHGGVDAHHHLSPVKLTVCQDHTRFKFHLSYIDFDRFI